MVGRSLLLTYIKRKSSRHKGRYINIRPDRKANIKLFYTPQDIQPFANTLKI